VHISEQSITQLNVHSCTYIDTNTKTIRTYGEMSAYTRT